MTSSLFVRSLALGSILVGLAACQNESAPEPAAKEAPKAVAAAAELPPPRLEPLEGGPYPALLVAQAGFGYAFSSFFLLPSFIVDELAGGPVEIGLVTAAYGVVILVLPLTGALVDRFGRRNFLTAGALLMNQLHGVDAGRLVADGARHEGVGAVGREARAGALGGADGDGRAADGARHREHDLCALVRRAR